MAWAPAPSADPALAAALAAEAGLSPLVAGILARRLGGDDPALWLRPESAPLCDPLAFPGMGAAAERLLRAVAGREPITVFGDYDVDGVTATATLVQGLSALGARVKPFFPDREREGYGLTPASVARCLTYAPAPTLLVTVDCGITSVEEVADLRARGIDVVVTDHHTPPATLPPANAVVNPRLGAPPGAEALCGCATALMLLRALAAKGAPLDPDRFLDLAAVATVADVMPLTGQNRALVAQGLRTLRTPAANPGLKALAERLRLLPGTPTAEDLAFSLVPCVNAAGRLGALKAAYALIGLGRADQASALIDLNAKRKAIERDLLARIVAAGPKPSGNLLLVGGEDFHAGVLGIVAARLMAREGLPVALVRRTPDGGGHGSMRACGTWHAVRALESVADLLEHFGGHAKAAGFTLRPGAYEAFRARLRLRCRPHRPARLPGALPRTGTPGALRPRQPQAALPQALHAGRGPARRRGQEPPAAFPRAGRRRRTAQSHLVRRRGTGGGLARRPTPPRPLHPFGGHLPRTRAIPRDRRRRDALTFTRGILSAGLTASAAYPEKRKRTACPGTPLTRSKARPRRLSVAQGNATVANRTNPTHPRDGGYLSAAVRSVGRTR